MKQIKLLKDHIHHGVQHFKDQIIEVTDDEYTWLMEIYLTERKSLVQDINKADQILRGENAK
jgi:hypothetical protein